MSTARQKFISQAESALGRSLRPKERKLACGFDETVVQLALESFDKEQIAGMLSDRGGNSRSVALLEKLASGADSVAVGWQRLLRFLNPRGRKAVGSFGFEAELEDFSGWFVSLLRSEPPPAKIKTLNFGLFESEGGCKLYVTGANTCDAGDGDWACANDWWPEGRYAPLEGLSKLHRRLREAGVEAWVIAQAVAILLIRAFFATQAGELERLLGARKLWITSGFDDGDLYAIRMCAAPAA